MQLVPGRIIWSARQTLDSGCSLGSGRGYSASLDGWTGPSSLNLKQKIMNLLCHA